jgi:PAS domain S-box-containing protein
MPPEPHERVRPRGDLSIEAKLRAAFELSPTVLAITTAGEGRLLEVNQAFVELHGYTREEVIGRTVTELDLWVDPRQRAEALARISTGSPVRNLEARLRAKGGPERVCLLNADIVVIDGRTCILSALTDITDRVRAEEALRESEQRFLLAFHANPLPMSITRLADGAHLEVNEAAVRHGGFTREEMLGRTKPALGFWVAPAQREALIRELHAKGQVRDFEVTFQTRTGAQRRLLVNSQVIRFGGEPAVLSVSIDVTERLELEAEMRARREEAEALAASLRAADRAKDEFLAMLGHELRNPLGTITNALALLDAAPRAEGDRPVLAVVRRQVEQLTRLVDDLLDMSRLTSGKIRLQPEPADLHAVARRCLEALAHGGRSARHQVTLEGGAAWCEADPARLEQIVNNLLDNALKYTPPGGRIVVRTGLEADAAVLRIRDTGKGIDPALLPRVFDFFVQEPQALDRARGGLGLGLGVVRRLVELHGGSVAAHSEGADRGSEFAVRLPVAAPRPIAADTGAASDADDTRPRRQRRVLVVEDNADARDMLRTLLELRGHVVEAAADGPSALLQLQAFRPDVALIDVGLPGIDGYTLARLAREQPGGVTIRLVAVTGYGQARDRQRALAAGFDRHVTKPVDPVALERLVSEL